MARRRSMMWHQRDRLRGERRDRGSATQQITHLLEHRLAQGLTCTRESLLRRCFAQTQQRGHLGHRLAFAVVENHDFTRVIGELINGLGQKREIFSVDHRLQRVRSGRRPWRARRRAHAFLAATESAQVFRCPARPKSTPRQSSTPPSGSSRSAGRTPARHRWLLLETPSRRSSC